MTKIDDLSIDMRKSTPRKYDIRQLLAMPAFWDGALMSRTDGRSICRDTRQDEKSGSHAMMEFRPNADQQRRDLEVRAALFDLSKVKSWDFDADAKFKIWLGRNTL